MEFLQANSLAVCGEPLIEVMDKYVRWNYAVEGKSLRVNFDKKRYAVIIWEKVVFRKWILVVPVVRELVVILFSA